MSESYKFTNGWSMKREACQPGFWILSDENGERKDRDQYRHDVIERHRLKVLEHIER